MLRRRNQLIAAAGAVVAAGALVTATAEGITARAAVKHPTVKLVHTSLGTLLGTSRGFTLYMFTQDRSGKDRCVKINTCASIWPPYTVRGKPLAGAGVAQSHLRTTTLPNGKHQVTYFGHPVYRYSGDSGPGQTGYVGFSEFGGNWYGLSRAGRAVK